MKEAPPKPIPGPDPRVQKAMLERALLEDPEEALTAHLTPIWPRPRKPGRRRKPRR